MLSAVACVIGPEIWLEQLLDQSFEELLKTPT